MHEKCHQSGLDALANFRKKPLKLNCAQVAGCVVNVLLFNLFYMYGSVFFVLLILTVNYFFLKYSALIQNKLPELKHTVSYSSLIEHKQSLLFCNLSLKLQIACTPPPRVDTNLYWCIWHHRPWSTPLLTTSVLKVMHWQPVLRV